VKLCVLQMADAGPAESTVAMLRAVGYEVALPDDALRALLRAVGCDTVLSPRDLTRGMGYDPLRIPEVGPEAMDRCAIYADIKAHRCYGKVVGRWPRLAGKVLWTRINGGAPEHVVNARGDHGDEVNPPCPVLTPDLWYRFGRFPVRMDGTPTPRMEVVLSEAGPEVGDPESWPPTPWAGRAYACWPPFVRADEYYPVHGRPAGGGYDAPVCLVHGASGWGYGRLFDAMRGMGVRVLGDGSPDGLVRHRDVPALLSRALCMVHLKSSDAPGYALLESLAAGCPVVCSRRLIWKGAMGDLLVPGETCLTFDRETHDGLTDDDVAGCTAEVRDHLERLRDPVENARIGDAGRARLREVMWSADRAEDVESLRAFMGRHFGE
jgi:glycosyltransferase involved in cell wall biosynthesis